MARADLISRAFVFLRHKTGRGGMPDPELPGRWYLRSGSTFGFALIRGFVRARGLVFLGRGVILQNRGGIQFGRGVSIGRLASVDGFSRDGVRLEDGSRVGDYCTITCTSHMSRLGKGFRLGPRSAIGERGHVGASGGVTIGADVIVGPYVSFHAQEHNFSDVDLPIRDQGVSEKGIVIGDNCWIGAKATVLDGTLIGHGSVIAAGAVVKGEFPPRSLIAGVPARVIRSLADA